MPVAYVYVDHNYHAEVEHLTMGTWRCIGHFILKLAFNLQSFQPMKSEHYWQEKVLKHCWPIGRKEMEIKYNISKPAEFRIVDSNEENK